MKELNWGNSYFTSSQMIPSSGDGLTTLFGIKLVKNLMNGYGIIGTIRLVSYDITWLNLGLTSIYLFPPLISSLVSVNNGALNSNNVPLPSRYYTIDLNNPKVLVAKRVQTIIQNDFVGVRWNTNFQQEGNWIVNGWCDVYFRIHGV